METLEDRRLLSLDFARAVTFGAGSANNVWYADQLAGLTADSSGNVYATGALQVNNGYSDGFVSKYDSAGNLQWRQMMGGTSWDVARQAVVDATGNVYVAGYYESNGSVGSIALPSLGMENLLVAKFSPNGTPLWARGVGSSKGDAASGLTLDAQGNVYVVGGFRNTADFGNAYVLTATTPSSDPMSGVLWKLDGATGTTQWAVKTFGDGWGYSIAKGPAGEIYVGGNVSTGAFVSQYAPGYTPGSPLAWTHQFALTAANATALAVDAAGGVYAGVTFTGSNGSNDGMMYKLDSAGGTQVWSQAIASGQYHDNFNAIAVDAAGRVYAGGITNTNGVYSPPTSNWLGWIDQVDPASGSILWSGAVGAVPGKTSDTRISAVATDSSGNVYLGGWFDRTSDLDPTANIDERTTSGGNDAYFVKLAQNAVVPNAPPVVTPPANQTANEGTSATFTLGSFTDTTAGAALAVGDLVVVESYDASEANTANRVILVNPVSGSKTLISQGGFLDSPTAVAIDRLGTIIVADSSPDAAHPAQIVRIDPLTGAQTVLASGGLLKAPYGLTVDAAGGILVADSACATGGTTGAILKIDPVTGAQSVAAFGGYLSGSAGGYTFAPADVTFDSAGMMYVAVGASGGSGGVRVVKVDAAGTQTLVSERSLSSWTGGIVVDASGTPFTSEIYYSNAIYKINPTTGAQTILTQSGNLQDPWDLALDAAGNLLVADGEWWSPGKIVKVNPSTGAQTVIASGAGGALLANPMDIAVVREASDAPWLVTVAWGDTTTSTFSVNNPGSLGTLPHTYADDGTYTVTLTVAEDAGAGAAGTGSFQVTVKNVAVSDLTLSANPAVIDENGTTTLSGAFVDPGILDTHTVTIDWGDGSPLQSVSLAAGVTAFSVPHQYLDNLPGNAPYGISVSLVEDDVPVGSAIWTAGASMQTDHAMAVSGMVGGKWYVVNRTSAWTVTMEAYDPSTATWSVRAPDPINRSAAAGGAIDGKLYVVAGWVNSDSNSPTNELRIYDPTTNTWSSGASASIARGSMAGAVIGHKLYVTGGRGSVWNGDYNTLEIYDAQTNSWSIGAPLPTARENVEAEVIDGKFYTVGGFIRNRTGNVNDGQSTGIVEVYDPATNTWSTAAPMPTARWDAALAVVDGKLYAAGGIIWDSVTRVATITAIVEVYDPATDTWSTAPSLSVPRWSGSGTVIDGTIYVAGGVSSNYVYLNSMEKFTPGAAPLTANTVVTVNNVAPQDVDAGADQTVDEGSTVSVSGTFSDPGTADTHTQTWSVLASNGQVIADGSGASFSFLPTDNGIYTLTYTVTDDDLGTSSDVMVVTVNNVAPQNVDAGADQAVDEGSLVSVAGTFSDPGTADTHTQTWSVVASNGQVIANGTGANFSFLPTDNGIYTLTYTVTDDDLGTSSDVMIVTVNNVAPQNVNAGADQTVNEGSLVSVTGTFNDPGTADTHTQTWSVVDGNGQVIAGGSGATFSFLPVDNGTYTLTYTVTDDDLGTSSDVMVVTVNNVAPQNLNAGADQTVDEGSLVSVIGTFSDPGSADTNTQTWSVVDGNGQVIADGSGASFSFLPVDNGTYTLTYTVTDDDLGTSSDVMVVTVNNVAPQNVDAGIDQTVDEGSLVSVTGTFHDPGSADTHTQTWSVVDGNGQVIANGSGANFNFLPTDNGTYTLTYTVTDDDLGTSSDVMVVTVYNVAPQNVDAGADQTVDEGDTVNVTGTFNDPGTADTHTQTWSVVDGNGQVIANGSGASFSFVPADNGTYTLTYTVTDDDLGTSSDVMIVTVNNVAPQNVSAGVDQTVDEGSLVSVTGTFNDPGSADTHTQTWSVVDGNGQVIAGGSGASFGFLPTDNGIYTLTYTVTDDDLGTSSDVMVVTVNNVAPQNVDAGADQTVDEGSTVNVAGSFSDPGSADTHTVTIDWGDGSALQSVSLAASVATFDVPHQYLNSLPGNAPYAVNVIVTDKDGANATAATSVRVKNVAASNLMLSANPAVIDENGTTTLSGAFVDPGMLDTHTVIIDWGDGSALQSVSLAAGVTAFNVPHQYLDNLPGNAAYDIEVSLVEDDVPVGSAIWTAGASMQTDHAMAVSGMVGGKWYVVNRTSAWTVTMEAYDPSTATWSVRAPDPINRSAAAGGAIDGKLYVVAGWVNSDSNSPTNALRIYDPTTNSWSSGPSASIARGSMAGAVIGHKLYVTGGRGSVWSGDYNTLEIYDAQTNTWSTGAPLPTARENVEAEVIDGKFYTVGGFIRNRTGNVNDGQSTGIVEVYDPATNTWSTAAPMPTPRWDAALAVVDGKLYAAGGIIWDSVTRVATVTAIVEVYDPVTNTWSTAPSLSEPRWSASGTVIDGTIYVAGGVSPTYVYLNSIEKFTPGATPLTASTIVTVNNVAPQNVNAGADQTVNEGSTVNVTGTFNDPGTADTHTQTWSVVDGNGQVIAGGSGASFSFVPVDNGIYTLTYTVTDDDLGTSSDVMVVTVNNVAPQNVNAGVDQTVNEGSTVNVTGTFNDPGTADTHTQTWSVVDGNGQVIAGGSGATFSFLPVDNGKYTLTYTVTDDDLGTSSDVMIVTVNNVAPQNVDAGADQTVDEGSTVNVTGTFNDPGTADTHTQTWSVVDGNGQVIAGGSGATFSFLPVDNGTYTLTYTVTDDDLGTSSDVMIVTVNNVAPQNVDAGVDQTVDEGSLVSVTGTFSDPGSSDTHTQSWSVVDGNGQVIAGGSGANFNFLPVDNGTYTLTYTVTDDDLGTSSDVMVVTVNNVAPVLGDLTNSSPDCGGAFMGVDAVTIAAAFTDVGTLDTHSVVINWGDGTTTAGTVTETVGTGSGTVSGSHVYATGGIFTITVTLADDDAGTAVATTSTTVSGIGLVNGTLYVIGTDGKDNVEITQNHGGGDDDHDGCHGHGHRVPVISVNANFAGCHGGWHGGWDDDHDAYLAGEVSSIVILLGGGNDEAHINQNVMAAALIDGGEGNDHLMAGGGSTILIGGNGDDRVFGGDGQNLLIGGQGKDDLNAGRGSDLLIGGSTIYDQDQVALDAIMAEWTSGHDYATTVANLLGANPLDSRQNGDYFLNESTVSDDLAKDLLTGGKGLDLFYAKLGGSRGDVLKDRKASEMVIVL